MTKKDPLPEKDIATPLITIPEEIGLSSKRWVVLLLYFGFGLANQIQYTSFTTIVNETKAYFDCSSMGVNLLAAIFPVVYAIGVFPGCHIYENTGLRGGLALGTGVNALGATLKFVAVYWPQYWLLLAGQFFNAIGQVLFLSLPPLVASTWFADDERTLATALGTLSGFVGMAVGMFYSPQIVHNRGDKEHFGYLMGSQFGLSAMVFIGVVLLVDSSPPMSPSVTANRRTEQIAIWPILKRQLKNRNLFILAMCFGMINGLFTGVAAVLSQMLLPFGISENQTGIIAFAGIISGSLNCGIVAPLVDKHRRYKWPIFGLFIIVEVLAVLMTIMMKVVTNNLVIGAYVLIIALEICILPVIPLVMELSVELTYPDPESISSSITLTSMCIWSAVGIIVYGFFLGDNPGKEDAFNAMLFTVIVVAIAIFGLLFVDENRLRLEKEQSLVSNASSPLFTNPNLTCVE